MPTDPIRTAPARTAHGRISSVTGASTSRGHSPQAAARRRPRPPRPRLRRHLRLLHLRSSSSASSASSSSSSSGSYTSSSASAPGSYTSASASSSHASTATFRLDHGCIPRVDDGSVRVGYRWLRHEPVRGRQRSLCGARDLLFLTQLVRVVHRGCPHACESCRHLQGAELYGQRDAVTRALQLVDELVGHDLDYGCKNDRYLALEHPCHRHPGELCRPEWPGTRAGRPDGIRVLPPLVGERHVDHLRGAVGSGAPGALDQGRRGSGEADDAADPVLCFHQVEAVIDLSERERV